MKNNTGNIQANKKENEAIKHVIVSKSRHLNFRDLLNEWNRTPPTKPNQLANSKSKDK